MCTRNPALKATCQIFIPQLLANLNSLYIFYSDNALHFTFVNYSD